LRLGLDIWNAMAEQHALGQGLRGARDQLRALAGRSLARATRGSLAALERLTDSLARATDAAGGELAGLETVVESADREPTGQARPCLSSCASGWRARSVAGSRCARPTCPRSTRGC